MSEGNQGGDLGAIGEMKISTVWPLVKRIGKTILPFLIGAGSVLRFGPLASPPQPVKVTAPVMTGSERQLCGGLVQAMALITARREAEKKK